MKLSSFFFCFDDEVCYEEMRLKLVKGKKFEKKKNQFNKNFIFSFHLPSAEKNGRAPLELPPSFL